MATVANCPSALGNTDTMASSPIEQIAVRERARREILVKSDLIPPLPDVVVNLLGLLNNADTEPQDLEKHLHFDPVLVAKMLGMVNSPFYGLQRKMTSIKDAIMVLGFGGLRSLLLASGTAKHLQGDFRCYGHDELGLWKHSLVVACSAKTLAAATGQSSGKVEELFIGGLLHDIGKMLLAPYLRDKGVKITAVDDVAEAEKSVVGLDHAEAGALVVDKWGLGPAIQDVLSHLLDREGAEDPTAVAIIRLAEAAALDLGIGYEPGAAHAAAPDPEDMQTLGLDEEAWAEVRASLDEVVADALSQLETLCA